MDARQQAIATVRAQQGLAGIPPANWTYAQRTAYNHALAAYILEHPGQFSAQDLGTAAIVNQRDYSALEDTSFNWAMFGEEFRANAGPVFAGVQITLNKVLAIAFALFAVVFVIKHTPSRD